MIDHDGNEFKYDIREKSNDEATEEEPTSDVEA